MLVFENEHKREADTEGQVSRSLVPTYIRERENEKQNLANRLSVAGRAVFSFLVLIHTRPYTYMRMSKREKLMSPRNGPPARETGRPGTGP